MPVLLNKGQTINGIAVPNGFVVFGLDKDTEGKLVQGGAGSPVNLAVLGDTDAAAVKGMVSAPWNQQRVSFDATLVRYALFGQLSGGQYIATSLDGTTGGDFARRLILLTGDPAGTPTIQILTNTATNSGTKKDTQAASIVSGNASITNAWVASNGDIFYVVRDTSTLLSYLFRAKAGTYTVGSDAGYTNNTACIDIGRYGGTQTQNVRVFSPQAFLDFTNSAGTRTLIFCEYNVNGSRTAGGTNDQVIAYKSTDGGTTWSVLLQFNTGGTHTVSHIHGVRRDPYTGLIYFMTGDSGTENQIIQWDGVSAAPAVNSTPAQIGATAGWRIIYGSELHRYTDLLFAPSVIYGLPDCDTENADTTSTAFVSTVIDKSLGWVAATGPLARVSDVPPALAVRSPAGWSAYVSFTANNSERYLHVWTIDGNPESGATWTLVAKLRNYITSGTGAPRSFWFDANGDLWVSATYPSTVQFSPETQSGTSVRLRAVPRRSAVDVYDLT